MTLGEALVADLKIAEERIRTLTAERDALNQMIRALTAERDAARRVAQWFASNPPGTPVPDWIDKAMTG